MWSKVASFHLFHLRTIYLYREREINKNKKEYLNVAKAHFRLFAVSYTCPFCLKGPSIILEKLASQLW